MSKNAKCELSAENLNFGKLKSLPDDVCSQIANRFGLYNSNGNPLESTVIDILTNSTCIACVAGKLTRQYTGNNVSTNSRASTRAGKFRFSKNRNSQAIIR